MDNVLMAGLSRQIALMRQVDAMANNIANVSTSGFKGEFLVESPISRAPAASNVGPRDVVFVSTNVLLRDFSQGALEQTGRDFDIALKGPGFFGVKAPHGTLYTRDGAFALDASGKLVTKQGDPVMSDAGSEIIVPQETKSVTVTPDGAVSADDQIIGKIGVYSFEDDQKLVPMGGNAFGAGGQTAMPTTGSDIAQGFLEGSNVQPVLQMTKLLEASRTYESLTRAMRAEEDLRSRSIDRLGRPQS
ncbi:MAG: flagellar basal-body rod protein FlgF [Caulobacterales bacterium]